MSDVKRYDPVGAGHGAAWMEPEAYGDYVTYDDYAALDARIAEVEEKYEECLECNEEFAVSTRYNKAEVARLTAQLATARRDALEKASVKVRVICDRAGQRDLADSCYSAIRALIAQEEPTT